MKNQTSGTLNVPASGIPAVGESVNVLTGQVDNLKKNSAKVCGFKKNPHLCSAQHLNQATMFANRLPLAFFVPIGYLYSSDPRVECLMASQPDSGVEQRESGTFLFPSRLLINVLFHFNCSTKMKNQTSGALIAPEPAGVHVSENLKALNEQVNNLQRRYYRALAPDCEIKTAADRWYLRAICLTCAGLVFPPLVIAAALCVYKAKKCRKGGEE